MSPVSEAAEYIVRLVFMGSGYTSLLQSSIDKQLSHLQVLSVHVSPTIVFKIGGI